MKQEIFNRLEVEIENVFYYMQDEFEIENGDITPELSIELDNAINNLVTIIEKVLEYQMDMDDEKQAIEYRYKKELEYDARMK